MANTKDDVKRLREETGAGVMDCKRALDEAKGDFAKAKGLIKERGPDSVTIVDATQQRTVVPKKDVKDERALTLSIMPEGLLTGLKDAELRDLLEYLQAPTPPK